MDAGFVVIQTHTPLGHTYTHNTLLHHSGNKGARSRAWGEQQPMGQWGLVGQFTERKRERREKDRREERQRGREKESRPLFIFFYWDRKRGEGGNV